MYFIVALICTIASALLWFFFKNRKALHLELLPIIFGTATLMWFIDVIFCLAGGEEALEFGVQDGWISLWTVLGGIFLWLILSFILNNRGKTEPVKQE